jgi:hypothetical protein
MINIWFFKKKALPLQTNMAKKNEFFKRIKNYVK